mgnify:CR=1 FL=1
MSGTNFIENVPSLVQTKPTTQTIQTKHTVYGNNTIFFSMEKVSLEVISTIFEYVIFSASTDY